MLEADPATTLVRPKTRKSRLIGFLPSALNYAHYVGKRVPQRILQLKMGGLYHDVLRKDNLFRLRPERFFLVGIGVD